MTASFPCYSRCSGTRVPRVDDARLRAQRYNSLHLSNAMSFHIWREGSRCHGLWQGFQVLQGPHSRGFRRKRGWSVVKGVSLSTPNDVARKDCADHPLALTCLYQMYLYSCFTERSYRFGLPLILANVPGGFQTVAIVGFVSPLSTVLFGPLVGQALDRLPRRVGLSGVVAIQSFLICSICALVLRTVMMGPYASIRAHGTFSLLLLLSMCERLTSFAIEVAVERDWVPQLAGVNNASALARGNDLLRKMDLTSELTGALAFGAVLTQSGPAISLMLLFFLCAACLPLQLWFVHQVASMVPHIVTYPRAPDRSRRHPRPETAELAAVPAPPQPSVLEGVMQGWRAYFRQPFLPASLAYIMLFFNAVLSPGGLMTAFLTSRGLSGMAAAAFRGGCAAMGLVGTSAGRWLILRFGVVRAGIAATGWMFLLLSCAGLIYCGFLAAAPRLVGGATSRAVSLATCIFCGLVVLSRPGLWAFDMVDAQLFQTVVSPEEAAAVSSAEGALCNLAEIIMLGIAAALVEPACFGWLVGLSISAVGTAFLTYTAWAMFSPTARRISRLPSARPTLS
eukprot:jgi/Botrbrau1/21768/Bobra.43_1s0158.1